MKDIVDKVSQNSDLVDEVYKDTLQISFKQVGKIGESLLKFVALPFSFLGMTAEQLEEKYKTFIAEAINSLLCKYPGNFLLPFFFYSNTLIHFFYWTDSPKSLCG